MRTVAGVSLMQVNTKITVRVYACLYNAAVEMGAHIRNGASYLPPPVVEVVGLLVRLVIKPEVVGTSLGKHKA